MHSNSTNISAFAMISSSMISKLLPACFSCINNFLLLHNSLGSEDKNPVFEKIFSETLEAETNIPGGLKNLISDLSLGLLLPGAHSSKYFSFANSNNNSFQLNSKINNRDYISHHFQNISV